MRGEEVPAGADPIWQDFRVETWLDEEHLHYHARIFIHMPGGARWPDAGGTFRLDRSWLLDAWCAEEVTFSWRARIEARMRELALAWVAPREAHTSDRVEELIRTFALPTGRTDP